MAVRVWTLVVCCWLCRVLLRCSAQDVDDCSRTGSVRPDPSCHVCENTPEGYTCHCREGFILTTDKHQCKDGRWLGCYPDSPNDRLLTDVRPPELSGSDSLTVERCIEGCRALDYTYGGPINKRSCLCGNNHNFDRRGIVNASECNTICPGNINETCGAQRRLEVYSVCSRGYYRNPSTDSCGLRCHCKDNHICSYSAGLCPNGTCDVGWTGSECGLRDCSVANGGCQHTCSAGRRRDWCSCRPGFMTNPLNDSACDDMNECDKDSATIATRCQHYCSNTDGSYYCTCNQGYRLTNDNHTCSDMNECDEDSDTIATRCQHHCNNTEGSYFCTCSAGYRLAKDRHSCEVISSQPTTEIIVTAICLVLALLIFVAIVIVIVRQRRSSSAERSKEGCTNCLESSILRMTGRVTNLRVPSVAGTGIKMDDVALEAHTEEDLGSIESSNIYGNVERSSEIPSNPIAVQDFLTHAKDIIDDPSGVKEEYKIIPRNIGCCNEASDVSLKPKNRFKNILPYDHNRVQLQQVSGKPLSHYINASFVEGRNGRMFIASQGPTAKSLDDFWRMVWEQKVDTIVMVTNVMEKGKKKCEIYWGQDAEPVMFGSLTVKMESEEVLIDYIIRKITVYKAGAEEQARYLLQYQYTSWPDHAVPSDALTLVRFRRRALNMVTSSAPVLVHCSAGVGRTGTLLALDKLIHDAESQAQIDVMKTVYQLRTYRMLMVQTEDQYVFLYTAIAAYLRMPCSAFSKGDFIKRHSNDEGPRALVDYEFETLNGLTTLHTEPLTTVARLDANISKTRDLHFPLDAYRVKLMTSYPGASDFINAVFVQGYRRRNAFISAQWPLPATVHDLWRMITDYKLRNVVVLNNSDTENDYPDWLPTEGRPLLCDTFSAHWERQKRYPRIRRDIITITSGPARAASGSDDIHMKTAKIQPSHCVNVWTLIDEEEPIALNSVISLNKQMKKTLTNVTGAKPMAVISRGNYGKCGIFIAMTSLMDMLATEAEVDVFYVAQKIQSHRPEFFESEVDYRNLHLMVKEYCQQL